jgi:dTDP-4-dehydrorhamnose 3,5-epimerase
MNVIETGIEGLVVLEPKVFGDERGWFQEEYNADKLAEVGFTDKLVQANHSFSAANVLRGLHFQQAPHAQSKLVRCLRGRLFDVAVDIRPGSPTCGQWFGVDLSDENHKQLLVPRGFAHGFYTLTDAELLYFCGENSYHPESEGGLRFDDPDLKIVWPFADEPVVNDRDRNWPLFKEQNLCE